jgi:hypothetical protein
LHSSQVVIVAPGSAPVPPQVAQASFIVNVTGTLPPTAAVRNGTVTETSTGSVPSFSSVRRPFPKIDEKMSPSPNEPKSPRSCSSCCG